MSPLLPRTRRRLPQATPPQQRAKLATAQPFPATLTADRLETLQVNLGKLCNQTCAHCHVDAGPDRRERMTDATVDEVLAVTRRLRIGTVDLTGGAPELHPRFRAIVRSLREDGVTVMVRSNLTVLRVPSLRDLPDFFAEQRVHVVASLPQLSATSTDRQRGDGVFEDSIEALRELNRVGYGSDPGLPLWLVSNPAGAYLPPPEKRLEVEWKAALQRRFGVRFDRLLCLTNMPISRFLEWLVEKDALDSYLDMLVQAFNPNTLDSVMCRSMLSVGWDGQLYDCDFNQMLELPIGGPATLASLAAGFHPRRVVTGPHCYGCTAGAGSSCGGSLT